MKQDEKEFAALRKYPRAVVSLPCHILFPNNERVLALVQALSEGGAQIEMLEDCEVLESVSISVPISNSYNLSLNGKRKWKNGIRFGIEFSNLCSRDKHVLSKLVHYHRL